MSINLAGENIMKLIKTVNDILDNAKVFDDYLNSSDSEEKDFALYCLTYGRCFVVIKNKETYKFYPSKYIGYQSNNMSHYVSEACSAVALPEESKKNSDAAYYTFDGRMSNKAINKVLKCMPVNDEALSGKFVEFCGKFGLKGSYKKKFWLNIIEQ